MLAFAKSEIGFVRKINEDSFIFNIPELFAVADGMGGHEAGEVASSLAVAAVEQYIKECPETTDPKETLVEAIQLANRRIYQTSLSRPECAGMGTTVTAAFIKAGCIYWGHVGDSRLYLLREQRLHQITKDHSLVGELLESGSITQEEAKTHPHRNILTRAVGTADNVQVDCGNFKLAAGDQILLCTDGLTGMVDDEEIEAVLSKEQSAEGKVEQLVARALEEGGSDNITAILIHCEDAYA